jgi:drug/metabolite transporter (DMT)-like permease
MPLPLHGRRNVRGVAFALSAACGYGSGPVLTSLALDRQLDPIGLLVLRGAIATSALAALWWASRSLGALAHAVVSAREVVYAAVLGVFVYGGEVVLFTFALQRLGAAPAVVIFYSWPAFVVLGERLRGAETITYARVAAVVVAFAGVAALAAGKGATGADALGLVLALGSALAGACLAVATAMLVENMPAPAFSSALSAGATVTYGGLALTMGAPLAAPVDTWPIVVALALLPSVFGVSLMVLAVREAGPSLAGLALTLEPVVAVVLAAVVLGESLSGLQLAGGALVLSGLLIAVFDKS